MLTMLPFTTLDLVFAVLTVSALVGLSVSVFVLARLQQPARRLVLVSVAPEAEATAQAEAVPVAASA